MPKTSRPTNLLFRPAPGLDSPTSVRAELRAIADITVRGRYEYEAHRHDDYEWIALARAPYHCELNGTPLKLRAGDVLVIKPGDRHSDLLIPPVRYYALRIA